MNKRFSTLLSCIVAAVALSLPMRAQVYDNGLIDKSIAIIGNDVILLSDLESEVKMMQASGEVVDKNARCKVLENMLVSKLFLTQARLDSLVVTEAQVAEQVESHMNEVVSALGGEKATEEYFGKPIHRIKLDWTKAYEEQMLIQQMQQQVYSDIPKITPADIKQLCEETAEEDMPMVPTKYKLRQIVIYPDKETASMAVKENLLELRERIINGEKFSSLARLYSQDPGSAIRGGELGMQPKSIYWPQFSDAAMSLKEGQVSQIVETPDGFHIIQMIKKEGDNFNARHILLKPVYSNEDRSKAFARLDSIRNCILDTTFTFEAAAWGYSEDPKTRTNGGQMVDEYTGSVHFEKDRLKPNDYAMIKEMEIGDISEPFESLDNEGRGNTIYKIVKLEEIIPSHVASYETDFDALTEMANQKNAMKAIDKFVEEKKVTTYVKIDPLFAGCEFVNEGWVK